jgi:hypothetical protein
MDKSEWFRTKKGLGVASSRMTAGDAASLQTAEMEALATAVETWAN